MENRNINNTRLPGAEISFYSLELSRLKRDAVKLANEFLDKDPSYWDSNAEEAQALLEKLSAIEGLSRDIESSCLPHLP
jgi:hypothetical protein